MSNLLAEQQALLDAILNRGALKGTRGLPGVEGGEERAQERGLQAYRGNAQGLSARTLASVFPRLHEAIENFDAMAWTFWRRHPPLAGDLGLWGGELPAFLAAQPGMGPALVELARLEWALHQAESAADETPDVASLALLGTHEPQALRLRFMPGLALLGQTLVLRQGWRAVSLELDAPNAEFTRSLIAGLNLHDALQGAGDFDFSNWLQQALRESWILRIERVEEIQE